MVYGIGQADNITGVPQVAMPKYTNGSLSLNQYPCSYDYPDLYTIPKQIELGTYSGPENPGYEEIPVKEDLVEDTQHKSAGEFTDMDLFLIVVLLLLITIGILLFGNK